MPSESIKDNNHFGEILSKLAGNVHIDKNAIPLFCFNFKMNMNEDNFMKYSSRFFKRGHFVVVQVDKIFYRLSLEHKKLRSLIVPEIQAMTWFIFLTVCDNSQ
jgi:hypothetical protein